MQGTESQPEPALAKEEPETSGFRHRGSKHSNDVISPPSRLPWWFTRERVCLGCRRHRRRGSDPWVGQIPWRRERQPTPVFLPGESHGQGSLVGCSPWGHSRLDTTWQLTLTHSTLWGRLPQVSLVSPFCRRDLVAKVKGMLAALDSPIPAQQPQDKKLSSSTTHL